jgi:hypothetical protein
VLSGDFDGGDASLEDAVSLDEKLGSPEDVVMASFERSRSREVGLLDS